MSQQVTRRSQDPTSGQPPPFRDRPVPGPGMLRWRRIKRSAVPWLFLAPALVFFGYFKFYPIAHGIRLSFYDVSPFGDDTFVGLDNFSRAVGDSQLHQAFLHTVVYVLVTVVVSMVLAFYLATVLEGEARHLRILRTGVFLPAVVTVAVVAEIWRILYHPTPEGLFNVLLGWAGLGPYGFINDPAMALPSIMAMQIWKSIPYDMVIFIAGLASVDRSLYEAAEIDGASRIQQLRHVTIPQITFTFTIVLVLGIIRGFRVFTEVFALTGGGPVNASEVIMTYVFRVSFIDFDLGYASAISTLLLILTVALTGVLIVVRRERD